MADAPARHGLPWSREDIAMLKHMYSEGRSYEHMANVLQRVVLAVDCKIKSLGLGPKDCSTYFENYQYEGLTNPCIKLNLPKENGMSDTKSTNRTVKTVVYIGNTKADQYTIDDLLDAIEKEEEFIQRLKRLQRSPTVDKLVGRHAKNAAALMEILAGKVED